MHEQSNEKSIAPPQTRRGRARLVGLGFDDADGHLRYTKAEGLELFGGSDQVHAEMQRRALIIQKHFDDLGISLDGMTYEQYLVAKEFIDRINAE